jgi:hypothetical protein
MVVVMSATQYYGDCSDSCGCEPYQREIWLHAGDSSLTSLGASQARVMGQTDFIPNGPSPKEGRITVASATHGIALSFIHNFFH